MSSSNNRNKLFLSAEIIFENGESIEWEKISRSKLIHMIKKYKPIYIGTDNPNEIIRHEETIGSFCTKLPSKSSIVHVNLSENGVTLPLTSILVQNGIYIPHKLDPLNTAKILNKLILQGVGMKLEPFENETIIQVNQPRRHGKGGWSQSRFERQGEEIVMNVANQIQNTFKNNDIEFDMQVNKTKFGAKWAQFHIFISKIDMDRILSKLSFFPAKIKIWSPKKDIITHSPIFSVKSKLNPFNDKQKIILGIDPGMETGIAIINLKGELIGSFSKKNLSRGELINKLLQYGTPVIICSDVSPAPNFVKKVAAIFNVKVYSPKKVLSHNDKKLLITKYLENIKLSNHEQDALAAVVYYFNQYLSKFEKIDKEDNLNTPQKLYAKQLIIQGHSISESTEIASALDDFKELPNFKTIDTSSLKQETELLNMYKYQLKKLNERLSYQSAELDRKNNSNKELRILIGKLNKKINKKENKIIKQHLKEELIMAKDNIINKLNKKINILENENQVKKQRIYDLEKMLWLSMETGGFPVKILPVFSIDGIHKLEKEFKILDGDIIFIINPTGGGIQAINLIKHKKLKFIFYQYKKFSTNIENILFENNIPFLASSKYDIRILDTVGIITKNNLELALKDFNKKRQKHFEKIKSVRINQTIINYKYEREREIEKSIVDYDNYIPEEDDLHLNENE